MKHLAELLPADLFVCEAVLVETCFHLPYEVQRERLRALLDQLDIDAVPTHGLGFWNDMLVMARQVRRS